MGYPHTFIWEYFNGVKYCSCGTQIKSRKELISLHKGYMDSCAKCRIKNGRQKAQESMIRNGTHQNSDYHKNKVRITKIKNWGHSGFVNHDKMKQTKFERYGDEYYSNQDKASATMLEKYGVHRFAKTEQFREHITGLNNPMYKHFTNIENFNDDFIIKTFIKNNIFNISEACKYFNCTYNAFKEKDYWQTYVNKNGSIIEEEFKILYNDNFIYNSRKIIPPLEIDLFSEKYKFGIEYNGLYWHSTKFKNNEYHLIKTERIESLGYQLFHIFENEWLNERTRNIWKSIINNKLNTRSSMGSMSSKDSDKIKVINNSTNMGFNIKELNHEDCKMFINNNHLEGYTESSIRLGLFINHELTHVMTFEIDSDQNFKLTRFCSKLNGLNNYSNFSNFSKVLNYFENKYITGITYIRDITDNPKSITCSVNRRWDNGSELESLGFKLIKITEPNCFYFKNNKPKILFSELKSDTNKENYRTIYDSGNRIYIKEYK